MKYKWYTAYAEMNKRFSLSVAMRIEKAFFVLSLTNCAEKNVSCTKMHKLV